MFPAKTARNAMISAENAVSAIYGGEFYSQGILCMFAGGDDAGMLRFDNDKAVFAINKAFLKMKELYSRILVSTAFDFRIHASPILS